MSIQTVLNELGKIKPAVGRIDDNRAPTAAQLTRIENKVNEVSAQVETVRRTLLMLHGRPLSTQPTSFPTEGDCPDVS